MICGVSSLPGLNHGWVGTPMSMDHDALAGQVLESRRSSCRHKVAKAPAKGLVADRLYGHHVPILCGQVVSGLFLAFLFLTWHCFGWVRPQFLLLIQCFRFISLPFLLPMVYL